ncbi:NAD(P)-binding domain-containing protein [Streptomyces sp. NPDC092307]|uniref:NAD(P)-binding domain-containing protein n=1 Tax=Streptomyces sp. NPDC092307 TaxID=3366013 RepID=UPI003825487B
MPEIHDLLVIGAGPYGLSIGAHAAAAGMKVSLLGTPMASWRHHMPQGMMLKSEPWASDLSDPSGFHSLAVYCGSRGLHSEHGSPTPLDTFNDYGLWFANAVAPPIQEKTVIAVEREQGAFRVTTSAGSTVHSRTVAVAVGMLPFRRYPLALFELAADHYSHSSDHHDLSRFRDQDVTVVGAGQGALETATLLAEAGARPCVIARRNRLTWNTPPKPLDRSLLRTLREPHSGLGTGWANWLWAEHPNVVRKLPAAQRTRIAASALGPAGSWWLRERFNSADITTMTGYHVRQAQSRADRVRLTLADANGGTTVHETDHVIAGTGFEPNVHKLDILETGLRASLKLVPGGLSPELNRGFESSQSGLFFAGLLAVASFGPSMRFVHGTRFTARQLVAGVRRRLETP